MVFTLQKADQTAVVSLSTKGMAVEDLLTKEWLLTNNCGGYASSTVVACNTRRYHGLLVGALNPPANRIVALANCMEMVILKGNVFNLSTFEFSNKFVPTGFSSIKRFYQDTGVHFDYELTSESTQNPMLNHTSAAPTPFTPESQPTIELTKSVYLTRDTNMVALVYDFKRTKGIDGPIEFVLRPFVALRDFHTLQKSYAPLCSAWLNDRLIIRYDVPRSCELFMSCPSATFERDTQWWFNFVYRADRQRGQDFTEDLWTPGFFKCRIVPPVRVLCWASLAPPDLCKSPEQLTNVDIDAVCQDLRNHHDMLKRTAQRAKRNTKYEILCIAADQFIAKRRTEHGYGNTILAGFPWFVDWGRDAFIALPGLLLSTGRFDVASSVLTTFARTADDGMIPNCFDDVGNVAFFNSVDASLWFIHAAFQYLHATGDSKTFTAELLPTIRWIIDSYHNGTRLGIHADDDGLICAGHNDTQLTWMDARYNGIAFTPRCGKAVEVNALWFNALMLLAQFYARRDVDSSKHYQFMSDQVLASFRESFWNEDKGYLNDCICPGGCVDASLRPNQIFAVSLPFSPLSAHQQKSVVDIVYQHLLTPYGLRTLSPQDSRYKGQYSGPQRQRDEAYHQGTVWPYLIGPFIEAYLKVNEFSRKSKKKAAEFIEPLMRHLTDDACLGSISEIFDGDAPHQPRGCIAQAWSVAELIRAYQLINS